MTQHTHTDLIKNDSFLVFIASNKLAFSKVSGLGGGVETDVYAEGGGVDSLHVMRKPKSSMRTIRFEKGLQTGKSKLSSLKPGLFVPSIQILVMSKNDKPIYEYYIRECWIKKWEISDLDAMRGDVIINTLEVDCMSIVKEAL